MFAETTTPERFTPCPVLMTERLLLRVPHEEDVPDLSRLANNWKVASMLSRMPHPYGETDARAFVARTNRLAEAAENGASDGACVYAITLADTGAFIGCAGLEPRNHPEHELELGYWIGEPFWNRGYATEAAHALVDLAFRDRATTVLHAACRVRNVASRRVIHKCGFQYVGQGMMDSLAAGRAPVERYCLTRKTWVGLRSWPQA